MRRAGCVGINFGTDSGDAGDAAAARDAATGRKRSRTPWPRATSRGSWSCSTCSSAAPARRRRASRERLTLMKRVEAERVGVSLGVRVYPGTRFAAEVAAGQHAAGLLPQKTRPPPLSSSSPMIAAARASSSIASPKAIPASSSSIPPGRRAITTTTPTPCLSEAIAEGYRGAYWDILRRRGRN